jgi:hypothetical protein
MRVRHVLLTLTLACVPSAAAADSDGYYCSAPGLLAFDTFIPGRNGRTINIVRFDPARGIQPIEQVEISDDIQTHDMSCTPNVVEVYSWDHLYVVDVSVPMAPKLAEKRASQLGRTALPMNLGHWSRRAEVVVLQSISDDDRFELVIGRAGLFVKGKGGVIYTSADLVHRVGTEIRAQQRLFFGAFRETVN